MGQTLAHGSGQDPLLHETEYGGRKKRQDEESSSGHGTDSHFTDIFLFTVM